MNRPGRWGFCSYSKIAIVLPLLVFASVNFGHRRILLQPSPAKTKTSPCFCWSSLRAAINSLIFIS